MPEDMTDDPPNGFTSGREAGGTGVQLARSLARTGQDADGLQVVGRERRDVRQPRPACSAEHPLRSQSEPDHFAEHIDGGPHCAAGLERRAQPQLAQARQLEPEHSPRPQFRVAQMPQGDPCCVEQLGVRVVRVRQVGQQFGDVIAGIQGRQIAAREGQSVHPRGLDQEVQRSDALGNNTISETPSRSRHPGTPTSASVPPWPAQRPYPARGSRASPPGWSRAPRSCGEPGRAFDWWARTVPQKCSVFGFRFSVFSFQ